MIFRKRNESGLPLLVSKRTKTISKQRFDIRRVGGPIPERGDDAERGNLSAGINR